MPTTITCPAEFCGKSIGTKFGEVEFNAEGKGETDHDGIIDTFRQVAANDPRFTVTDPPAETKEKETGDDKGGKPAKGGKGKPAETPPFEAGKVVKTE